MLAFIAVYTRSGRGIYPSSDPWGKPFSGDYEPARFKKAGQLLVTPGSGAARGIFDGIQADLEFVKKILFLQRNSTGFSKPYSVWIGTTLYVRPDNYIETKETTLGSSAASCAGLFNGFTNMEIQLVCPTIQICCTLTSAHKPCIALRFPVGSSLYIVQMFRVFRQ